MDPRADPRGVQAPGAERFVSSQPQYNMLWRGPEREVFELCSAYGIGQIVFSPLAQGVLTGKYVCVGLKPIYQGRQVKAYKVAPRTGAWIETCLY